MPTVMCIMTRPVNGHALRAAYCLRMLLADTSTAVAAAEAQEGTALAMPLENLWSELVD